MKKYISFGSIGLIFVILFFVFFATDSTFVGSMFNKNEIQEITPTPTLKPTAIPTPSPIPHVFGQEPLVVIDCSGIDDLGLFAQICNKINEHNNIDGYYIKGDIDELPTLYDECVNKGLKVNLILAQQEALDNFKIEFFDISDYSSNLLLNDAAQRGMNEKYLPLSLLMYAYYARADIIHELDVYVPRKHEDILYCGDVLQDQYGRYGFGVAANGVSSELMIKQIDDTYKDEGLTSTTILHTLWHNQKIPPDSGYWDDKSAILAYMNDACALVYSDGYLLEELIDNEDSSLYDNTLIIPYFGLEETYCAHLVAGAIVKDSNEVIALEYMNRIYKIIDDLIIDENPSMLHPGMIYDVNSPFKDVLKHGNKIIFYSDDINNDIMRKVIFEGTTVYEILGIDETLVPVKIDE